MEADKHVVKILEIDEAASNTLAVKVEKPEGFVFTAGQFVQVHVPTIQNEKALVCCRWFSIASAPHEEYLLFAFRKSDSVYKQAIAKLQVGDSLEISDPKGQFTLPEDNTPVIFLVGGVGITPVRSMIMDEAQKNSERVMYLFYSNWTPEEATFYKDLTEVNLPNYHAVCTMNDMSRSKQKWEGETCLIDMNLVKKYAKEVGDAIFYIVGPPGFIKAMREMMEKESVPHDRVKLEIF